jgi:hypothetical protein
MGVEIEGDPDKTYEITIRQALQNQRHRLVESGYQHIVNELDIPNAIAKDVHGFDVYRRMLSLGFFPLTEMERFRLTSAEVVIWKLYEQFRNQAQALYRQQLDAIVHEKGELRFSDYIQHAIQTNNSLTAEEKEEIIEKSTNGNGGQWTVAETNSRFHRLMLVMLGVLRKNTQKDSVEDAWMAEIGHRAAV